MATYLDGSGKIWMALSGFDLIWEDLVGFGWIWCRFVCGFLSWILLVMEGFIGIQRSWMDLAGSGCRFVWISKFDFFGYGGI